MYLNVRGRGDHIATFRWIEVRVMEMLAAWVPTTPEMEVKIVFGGHIWDVAQHADALGKRTHELRLPLHATLAPSPGYVDFLADIAGTTETSRRIAAFYDCLLPALDQHFRDYLNQVDTLLDGPGVRVIERIMADNARMMAESRALRNEVPAVRITDPAWLHALREREVRLRGIVVPRPSVSETAGAA